MACSPPSASLRSASFMSSGPFASLPRPLLFAHRGASAEAPENTLRAFELAAQAQVDVLEMDVHLSRDGVVVVHHDASLERTTNGSGLLAYKDYDELRRLDAGYRFKGPDGGHAFRGGSCRIPRLAEVLEAFPHLGFNIELKQEAPSMVSTVLKELERYPPREVLLAAANGAIMRQLEAAEPGVPLGLSAPQCWRVWWRAQRGRATELYRGRALQVPPRYWGVLPVVSERVIRCAHRAGIEVHLWTINHAAEAERWLARGVDGLMSDDPRRVISAVRAARSSHQSPR